MTTHQTIAIAYSHIFLLCDLMSYNETPKSCIFQLKSRLSLHKSTNTFIIFHLVLRRYAEIGTTLLLNFLSLFQE